MRTSAPVTNTPWRAESDVSAARVKAQRLNLKLTPEYVPLGRRSLESLRNKAADAFNIASMSQTIRHHPYASSISEAEVRSGQRPEARQAAQMITERHTQRSNQLRTWLQQWSNIDPVREEQRLVGLDLAPLFQLTRDETLVGRLVESDRAWREGSVRRHERIIASQIAVLMAIRPELRDFALNVVQSRPVQRAQFQAWLMLWYGQTIETPAS
ncbi:hypothetical protein DAETH_45080 (plasmid) [Deinococcus aetherius]|uniref:DUF305 domain-containing protein n=1 Tax=Deinococcus aetherius TaxID=200252 RepID=A0ABN6RNQ5_9DEIO|nr:DUF305 domain-containing protein [Deinococcus aetherius]BDP44539.1 hypothetical protein DAETH_45080 [Deinococcus aetherius]